ncbi:MAG TPA: DUF2782 domain-containing protein [Rhodocyclaceae bacterium]|jgi:hypothetical protein|nr:DUF2782 domain-containing protein [Rhodocyclaceae bacterium]
MRRIFFIFALLLALPAVAQTQPEGLQPLPDLPPPPQVGESDTSLEPQVVITKRGNDRVEEYRANGKLYMLKITPPHGVPYYLIDEKGDGKMSRQDSMDSGLRVPMWVIGTF